MAHPVLRVPFRAQHVDEVTDLVADDGADGAVVRGVRRGRVELGRLQQRGGKVVRVLLEHEDGADRLRRDPPFGHVHGPAQPSQGTTVVAVRDAPQVAHGVRAVHGQVGIVLPRFRIADAEIQRLQLGQRLRPGAGRHPGRRLDPSAERRDDVAHDGFHPGLLLGREIAFGVHPPQGVAHGRLGRFERALGARGSAAGWSVTASRIASACSAKARGSTSA